jgi:hypothetical protein
MPRIKNLVGQKFNRLLVVEDSGKRSNANRQVIWKCLCDCGNYAFIESVTLKRQKSCGCIVKERVVKPIHGHCRRKKTSKTYFSWASMIQRCTNKNNPKYPIYGGRGITVCEQWKNDFAIFLKDMGVRPNGMTLERINVNGNYEPSNCIWDTPKAQANNKRCNRILEFDGKKMTVSQWSDFIGISHVSLRMRLHRKWPLEKALCK